MVRPVHAGRALQSLRNSDFDTLSSMGEVIDNSLQADAKNIRIRLQKIEIRKDKYDIVEIAFADDGRGMDIKTLSKCLQLGFSDRYNDRKGIGRFGVGMTLGAITQCTRIEVYSKPHGGDWNMTYIDLNELRDDEDAIIPAPKSAEIPRVYSDLVQDYGTLVIWKNLDREDATIDEMKIWIGRTYRKFIGHEIIRETGDQSEVIKNPDRRKIFLDDGEENEEISALDPLYVTKTKYNSERTVPEAPSFVEEIVSEIDPPLTKPTEPNKITIRMSLTPEEWRPKQGASGNSTENRRRHIPANEGVSILRNDREVFYGHLPYSKLHDKHSSHQKGFIDMDRFWGCEISFDAELDHWFSIKNVKVGAKPLPELRKKIEEAINPTIYDFREEIRKCWRKIEDKEKEEMDESMEGTDNTEDTIDRTTPGSTSMDDDEMRAMLHEASITEKNKQRILIERLSKRPVVFNEEHGLADNSPFMDITTKGSKSIITMNMKHPFFRKFMNLRNSVLDYRSSDKESREKLVKDIDTNLQILLASFVMARKDLDLEDDVVFGTMDKLLHNWTFVLSKNAKSTLEN